MIIDAHIHLPVISEQRTYKQSKALLLKDMKKVGVNFSIMIPDNIPDSEIGDVPTCLRLVQDTPALFLMGTIDIQNQGLAWIRELENLINQKRIVGMKIFPGHDPIYPTDPRLDPVYERCQDYGIPMVIHTGANPGHPEVAKFNDPKYIVQVSDRYPKMKIVIAHLFWPEVDYCYQVTHTYPRIYYDTSGLADKEVIEATSFDKIQHILLKILQDDPKRVIFGTDYAMCSVQDHIEMINKLPVSEAVKEFIFWRNAVEVFKLPVGDGL
jgi:predicted TIM-barrel fold metal-dependent hydrolase